MEFLEQSIQEMQTYPRKWEDAFCDLMDEIYFKGYSAQLLQEKPDAYELEYFYFITLYD
jgi:hypothetical protein